MAHLWYLSFCMCFIFLYLSPPISLNINKNKNISMGTLSLSVYQYTYVFFLMIVFASNIFICKSSPRRRKAVFASPPSAEAGVGSSDPSAAQWRHPGPLPCGTWRRWECHVSWVRLNEKRKVENTTGSQAYLCYVLRNDMIEQLDITTGYQNSNFAFDDMRLWKKIAQLLE